MRLKESLAEIFTRPVPVVSEGTKTLVAGTLLDTPRRDVLLIARSSPENTLSFVSDDQGGLMVFSGRTILSRLLESKDQYMFLFEPIEKASISILPITASEEITSLLRKYAQTGFGWAVVEDSNAYAVATLPDLIPLYKSGVLDTDLCLKDVASPKFALPGDTKLTNALYEMMRHRVRRVFLSGRNRFVSDREILSHIFSPARLALVRESPQKILEATLDNVGSAEPIAVDGSTTLREASKLFKPESGAWCLTCGDHVVTPWDVVVKPWEMGRLRVRDTIPESLQNRKQTRS